MERFIQFLKTKSPLVFLVIGIVLITLSYFLEKKLPNIFMGFRLLAFVAILYGLMKFFNKK